MKLSFTKLSVAALVASFAASGVVNAADAPKPSVTLYGKAHLAVGSVDDDDGDATQMKSNSSRLGVKGSMDVEEGIKVTYKVEWQVDMADNADSDDNHIKGRNQYVGLAGSFGEVRIGRHDTIYKTSTGSFDILGDTYLDYNNIIDKSEDLRENNTIAYLNKVNDIAFGITYTLGDEDTANDGEGAILSLGADYKAGPLVLAGGYQDTDEGHSAFKFGAAYTIDAFTFGGVLEQVDTADDDVDEQNIFLMGKYQIDDKNCLKLMYGQKDIDNVDDDPNMFGIGFDHKFNKYATVYAQAGSGSDDGLSDASGLSGDSTAIAFGMILSF